MPRTRPREITSASRSVMLAMLMLLCTLGGVPGVVANPQSGTITTFADGSSSVTVATDSTTPVSVNLSLLRNTTIDDAMLHLTYDVQDPSPGHVTLDVDDDGMYEWHLGGNGDGSLGEQTEFAAGVASTAVGSNGNMTWLNAGSWRLPRSATMASSEITVGFTPTLGAQFAAVGAVSALEAGDMNGDGREDAIYLVTDHTGTNGTEWPHIGWTTWTGSAMSTSWIPTCADADGLLVGDANNDTRADVLVIASSENTLCQHLSGTSAWAHSVNISLDPKFEDAVLADLDGDGQADLVTLDADGRMGLRGFSGGAFASTAITTTVSSGSQIPMTENFAALAVGSFYGSGPMIAVAEDDMMADYNTLWNFSAGSWQVSTSDFECTGGPMTIFDWDADGVDDILGPTASGGCLATWNGSAWSTASVSLAGLHNISVGDHDRDGDLELFRPDEGSPDGSDTTRTGGLSMHDFDGSGGVQSASVTRDPHTSPRALIFADLDGDGLDEQVVAAGEASPGLFLGAWHTIEWDLESDGTADMSAEGYASATAPLSEPDQGMLIPAVAAELINSQTIYDTFETAWAVLDPTARARGAGTVTQSALNMTYTATFTVESNPTNTNLSVVLNSYMQLGTGSLELPLNITASRNGTLTLDSLQINWVEGATTVQAPPAPVLSLFGFDHSQVSLSWTNTTQPGDLIAYQLFRTPAGTQFNINQPLIEMLGNGYQDVDGVTNADWDYAVRSVHEFGSTSTLSNVVTVQVPDTPPPVDTTPPEPAGVGLADVPDDMGGALNLTWTPSASSDVAYTLLFVENADFGDATGMTPLFNLSAGESNTSFLLTGLTDGENHWAAAVAVDTSGNAWWNVTTVGPVHATNDTTRASSLSMVVTGAGAYDDGSRSGVEGHAGSPLHFAMQLTSEGAPMAQEAISLSITSSKGTTSVPLVTDVTGSASHGWDDWLDFVSEVGAVGGEIQVSAGWAGGDWGAANQAVAPASAAETVIATVDATVAAGETSIQLDGDGRGFATLSVDPPLGFENAVLEGLGVFWQLGNGTTVLGANGTLPLDASGDAEIPVAYMTGGWLDLTPQAPWWLSLSPETVRIDLLPPPPIRGCMDAAANNFDDDAELDDGSCTYDAELQFVLVDCEPDDWVMWDNATRTFEDVTEHELTCALQNPNDVNVLLDFDFDASETRPGFSHDLESSQVWIEALSMLNFTLQPMMWPEGTTVVNGTLTVTISMSATDWVDTQGEFVLFYGFDPAPAVAPPVTEPPTTSGPRDEGGDGSNTMLILGAVGGLVAVIVAFVALRILMRDPEDEEDEEETMDWAAEAEKPARSAPALDDLPTGRSLDELTTRGATGTKVSMTKSRKVDRRPGSRPTPIHELIEEDAAPEPEPEETHEAYEDHGDEGHDYTQDEDYHVDEEGVEWWKDEVGQWWYKYPDEEDWEAFEE